MKTREKLESLLAFILIHPYGIPKRKMNMQKELVSWSIKGA